MTIITDRMMIVIVKTINLTAYTINITIKQIINVIKSINFTNHMINLMIGLINSMAKTIINAANPTSHSVLAFDLPIK